MIRLRNLTAVLAILTLSSCGTREPPASSDSGGARAVVVLSDGTELAGSVKSSSASEITLVGDDRITRTIPTDQVRSIEYGAAAGTNPAPPERGSKTAPSGSAAAPVRTAKPSPVASSRGTASQTASKTRELPIGAEISVRTGETIDSGKAREGQTFAGEITRNVVDDAGDIVIPRGSDARIVIKSASKGGRFRGASDLVLDLQSVRIGGREHSIDTAAIARRGKDGAGANKRTAEYVGGGAALGAVIGAIAGGGKGAAIGAASGAGAGAVTQAVTKGGAIRVPVETILTFKLDKRLRVAAR